MVLMNSDKDDVSFCFSFLSCSITQQASIVGELQKHLHHSFPILYIIIITITSSACNHLQSQGNGMRILIPNTIWWNVTMGDWTKVGLRYAEKYLWSSDTLDPNAQ